MLKELLTCVIKVSDLQSKLSPAAKHSLDRRFGALYDKIYREDVVLEAWKRVAANRGALGVDRQDFEYIEDVIGVDQFLMEVREQLKSERYRAQPVLRCYIDKPGKAEKRPLGLCRMAFRSFDRTDQAANTRSSIGRRYSLSLEELIGELTQVIRGWNNYHKATRPVLKRLRKLNGFVRERLRIFLKRKKYSDQSRGTWRAHNNLLVRLGLYQFG